MTWQTMWGLMAPRRALLWLAVVLAAGLWLRGASIGEPSFETDEFFHVLPARRLLDGDDARLPSGRLYQRAEPYTEMVAASFRIGGVSEASARFPSVMFGGLVVVTVYLVGRQWFGVWPALTAAALTAVAPDLVGTSRLCRMYSLFQLLYLWGLFAYERAAERRGVRARERLAWLVAGAALVLGSWRIHPLTLDMAPAIAAYWLVMALAQRRTRYAWYLLSGAVVAAAGVAFGWLDAGWMWDRANQAPSWSVGVRYDYAFYTARWAAGFPWIWWLLPVAALFLCRRYGAIGCFTLCQLAVPFALHSIVFDAKSPRYVSHLVPWLALVVAPCLVWLVQRAREGWRDTVARQGRGPALRLSLVEEATPRAPARRLTRLGAVALAAVVAVAFQPAIAQSIALQQDPHRPRWRQVYRALAAEVRSGDAVLASVPEATLYYLGRPATHVVNNVRLDRRSQMHRDAEGRWVDWYTGVPLVTNLEELRRVRERYARGWLVADRERFLSSYAVSSEVRAYVEGHWEACPSLADASVMVYRWGAETVGIADLSARQAGRSMDEARADDASPKAGMIISGIGRWSTPCLERRSAWCRALGRSHPSGSPQGDFLEGRQPERVARRVDPSTQATASGRGPLSFGELRIPR